MAGGLSGKGDGRGGRSLDRGFEEGRGGRSVGRGGRSVGRGGCSIGHRSEDGRGGRQISLGLQDGYDSVDGLGGRPAGRASGEGHGSGGGLGNLSYAPPPVLQRPPTLSSRRAPTPPLQRAPPTQSSAPPPALQHAPTTHTPSHTPLSEDELPRSPSIPAAGTSLIDQTTTPSENASSSNSKPLLKIVNKIFTPSHVASAQTTKCIKQRFDKEGYTWSAVSPQTKEYYWNEFQKHFSFDRDLSVVREIFERQAGIRYSGTLCEWRKSGKRPVNVPQETWDNWQRNWNTPEFKKKCSQASQNRLSEVAGQGNGPSTHSGGSRSAIDHSIVLAKDLGRPVTDYDVFVRMHKKADGKFVDKRSENVAEEVIERYNAVIQNQTDDEENSSTTVDLSAIYYEVAGPLKKKRVYGLGSKPSAAISDCNSSKSALPDRDQMRVELYEEMREEMIKRQEEMEQQMRERQEHMELEWKQKQKEMEDFIQRFVSGGGPSTPPTDTCPTDDDYAEDRDLDEDEE